MQLKIHINGVEEMTLTSIANVDMFELQSLFSLFGELLPSTKITVLLLDHENTKSTMIFNQKGGSL